MKDKNDKDIEQILLNDENYEKFLSKKIENEFTSVLEKKESKTSETISDITKLSKKQLFSKKATYFVINKENKTKSYINGLQAEGFLGNNDIVRRNFLQGQINYFVIGDYYIKFIDYKK